MLIAESLKDSGVEELNDDTAVMQADDPKVSIMIA